MDRRTTLITFLLEVALMGTLSGCASSSSSTPTPIATPPELGVPVKVSSTPTPIVTPYVKPSPTPTTSSSTGSLSTPYRTASPMPELNVPVKVEGLMWKRVLEADVQPLGIRDGIVYALQGQGYSFGDFRGITPFGGNDVYDVYKETPMPTPSPIPSPTPRPGGVMYALDARTGADRWFYKSPWDTQAYGGTMVGQLLYFSGRENGGGVVYALDGKTGLEKWRVSLKQPCDGSDDCSGSIVAAAEDAVYVEVSSPVGGSAILALDALTGATRWEICQVYGSYSVYDYQFEARGGILYMKDKEGTIYALHAKTGRLKWQYTPQEAFLGFPSMGPSSSIVDGVVYEFVTYSIETQRDSGYLYAVDAATGAEKWKVKLPISEGEGLPMVAAVGNGIICVMSRFNTGGDSTYLYRLDKETGQMRWKVKLPISEGSPLGAAIGDGIICISTSNIGGTSSYLYGLDRDTGQERWKLHIPENWQTRPIMENGMLYLGAELMDGQREHRGNLYAIEPQTGKARWRFPVEGGIIEPPVAKAGMLYFAGDDGAVYALHP